MTEKAHRTISLLTGENSDWQLNVFNTDELATPTINAGYMNSDYTVNTADGWENCSASVQLDDAGL